MIIENQKTKKKLNKMENQKKKKKRKSNLEL